MADQTIHCISIDDFVTCPKCGRLADFDDKPVSSDEDGPIYKAACPDHGEFLWQVFEDEEEDD